MACTTLVAVVTLLLCGCKQRQKEPIVAPWGEIGDSTSLDDDFDLYQIQAGGELIVLTLTGPETYYDYHGRHLGTQYMLAQRFADRLGVSLRVEVCRDSAEMVRRLKQGDADLIAYPVTNKGVGWLVGDDKEQLSQELLQWYKPELLDKVRQEEKLLLTEQRVKRHVFAPMLNRRAGIISRYDRLFIDYSRQIRWDWRLMAAQCYQESTFDPQAVSFAGARGLMQIMPSTADHLGLPHDKLFEPESNIAAATRYLAEIESKLHDIPSRRERLKFVLACYNGGFHHVSDARALAQRDGRDDHRWNNVAPYILKLATPQFYNDPIVKHGYMRGSETVDYVEKIMARWQSYHGVKTPRTGYHERKARTTESVRSSAD